MHWDMRTLGARDAYKLLGSCIVPRPIAWVSSQAGDGTANLAPFSFFNAVGNDPPVVVIGLVKAPDRALKDTASNIRETGEFVINLVSERDAQRMNQTSANLPPEGDEAMAAGIEMLPSLAVRPQRVASAPAAFECRTLHYIEPARARSPCWAKCSCATCRIASSRIRSASISTSRQCSSSPGCMVPAGICARPTCSRWRGPDPAGASSENGLDWHFRVIPARRLARQLLPQSDVRGGLIWRTSCSFNAEGWAWLSLSNWPLDRGHGAHRLPGASANALTQF